MGRLSLLPQAGSSSLPVTPRFTPGDSPAVVLRNGVLFQGTQAAKSPLGPEYYNLPNNDIVKKQVVCTCIAITHRLQLSVTCLLVLILLCCVGLPSFLSRRTSFSV